jgi:putative PIN family toxin of toxin-antitoxin system
MRIVLDTNILARSARGGTGPAAETLRRALLPPHLLISSPFLLLELSRVLNYARVRQMHGLDEAGISSYVERLRSACLVVSPASLPTLPVVPADPTDDLVIATAIAGHADVLCTLDRHLWRPEVQTYCAQHGIRIMGDVELLRQMRDLENEEFAPE